jgi:hypothetical protein
MFHEVRVLNSKGKVQKILSADQLSRSFWEGFRDDESKMGFRAANNAKFFKKSRKMKSQVVS